VLAQQSDARQRQAAAEAYDQGTAAYLSGDYEKAAEWFETANRMSPAAPALIQAARAHQQAGHQSRAATLALRIVTEYPNEAAAVQYAQGLLDQLAAKFVRIDVACDGCTLDVDGTLQESQSFFVEPDQNHQITASFETGERKGVVSGSAGETKTIEITAPPPMPHPPSPIEPPPGGANDNEPKPLPPLATFIGAGVTAALLGTAIWSRIDTNNGVDPYKSAAMTYQGCVDDHNGDKSKCTKQYDTAKGKYDDGKSKETRTTVLWVATGLAGAATGVIALFFTDWSGEAERKAAQARAPRLTLTPTYGGAMLSMKGQF
jgi:tetratricopeptide (TPR) repeat protein